MSEPFIGEIRMFGGNYAPVDWAFCNGQLLAIADYDTLFSLIGTTYGGDGQSTFGLPDLRGRVPLHVGTGFVRGQAGGQENVTLQTSHLPIHSHVMQVSNDNPTLGSPQGSLPGQSTNKFYRAGNPTTTMAQDALAQTGGSRSHSNIQPFLCINFIIALQGIYPTQS